MYYRINIITVKVTKWLSVRYSRHRADALLLLRMFCSIFFLLLIPLFDQNLRSLLLSGNNRDRTETLTQCEE